MFGQTILAFSVLIPVLSRLSTMLLHLQSTCLQWFVSSENAFPTIGKLCCSFQLRTDFSILRYLSLTRTISFEHKTLGPSHTLHHLALFSRVAVSIPDVSNIPSCMHSPVTVWSTSDLLLLSRELCCIRAGCLFLKGHFLVWIPTKGDQARIQPFFFCVLILLGREIKAPFRCAAQHTQLDNDVAY